MSLTLAQFYHTPLHLAVIAGSDDIVLALLQKGSDANAKGQVYITKLTLKNIRKKLATSSFTIFKLLVTM